MSQKIAKAVFPVAGMGTPFLAATKAKRKERLPSVGNPRIEYAADEAIAAGITQLVFVTISAKRAIVEHFDQNFEFEAELMATEKQELLKLAHDILPKGVP